MPRLLMPIALASLLLIASARCDAAQIDLSLNLLYDVPIDSGSGGVWQVVAKSDAMGIASLGFQLQGARAAKTTPHAPAGTVNSGDQAGFHTSVRVFNAPTITDYLAQQNISPPAGPEAGVFYGVGTRADGSPGDLGPTYATLANLVNTPWATGDALGDPTWDTATLMFSGTFRPGDAPQFYVGDALPMGQVYTSLGTATTVGTRTAPFEASFTTRTNLREPSADYNRDGRVDTRDFLLWRDTLGEEVTRGAGADGDFSGRIGPGDYVLWNDQFGASPGGAGGPSAGAVPTPSGQVFAWLCVTFCLGFPRRIRGRRASSGIFMKMR